jgi:hypothetical protein
MHTMRRGPRWLAESMAFKSQREEAKSFIWKFFNGYKFYSNLLYGYQHAL